MIVRLLRVIATNLGVLLLLVGLLNLTAVVITELYESWGEDDPRGALPNYAQAPEQAEALFSEFRALESSYRPFVAWSRTPYAGTWTTIGADGRRQHTPDPADPPDAPVVAFFGGSVLWGTGAPDDRTIPAIFDHMTPAFRAENHGQSGYNSRQSLEALIDAINIGHPLHTVVLYEGGAGVPSACKRSSSPNSHGQEALMRDRLDIGSWRLLVEPSAAFVRRLFKPARGEDPQNLFACDDDPAIARRVAEVMVRNWRHARAIARDNGLAFHLVLAPVASFGAPRLDHLTLDPVESAQFEAVYPLLRELSAGEPWIHDLADAFDGDSYIYLDHCHVSDAGNERVAARIAAILGVAP